jgi:hypothetical protein
LFPHFWQLKIISLMKIYIEFRVFAKISPGKKGMLLIMSLGQLRRNPQKKGNQKKKKHHLSHPPRTSETGLHLGIVAYGQLLH